MNRFLIIPLILFFSFNPIVLKAQTLPENVCVIENGELKFRVNINWSVDQFAELRRVYALDSLMLEGLIVGKQEFDVSGERWVASKLDSGWILLQKPVKKQTRQRGLGANIFLKIMAGQNFQSGMPGYVNGPVPFGINQFRRPAVVQDTGNWITFSLFGFKDAKTVILSGSFNQWATSGLELIPSESGWKISLKLAHGKYYYKFIVDGRWISDPENYQSEPDGHGGKNSVVFVTNYELRLCGNLGAASVFVAGSFNNWNQQQCKMTRDDSGWVLPVFLCDGKHNYKFIVDGQWILDPCNSLTVGNEYGTGNSLLTIGHPRSFFLRGFPQAKKVVVAGSFNGWSRDADPMQLTDSGWVVDCYFPPGNHEYKFVVDGAWMIDSLNPVTLGSGEFTNSFVTIEPNFRFRVEGFEDAKSVIVTGNFNGWIHHGYQMKKDENGWYLDVYLPKGKIIYRIIVDGKWMHDPTNPNTEPNEYDGLNSVLWIE